MPLRIDWLKIIPLEGVWLEHQELFCFRDLLWLNQSRDTKTEFSDLCYWSWYGLSLDGLDDWDGVQRWLKKDAVVEGCDFFWEDHWLDFDHGIVLDDSKQMAISSWMFGVNMQRQLESLSLVNDERPTQVCLVPEFWHLFCLVFPINWTKQAGSLVHSVNSIKCCFI